MWPSPDPLTRPPRRRRRWRWPLLWLGISLLTFGPLLLALGASELASLAGCALDEGSVHPCVIGGADRGDLLYSLFVLGWLSLVTLPLGLLVGWALGRARQKGPG